MSLSRTPTSPGSVLIDVRAVVAVSRTIPPARRFADADVAEHHERALVALGRAPSVRDQQPDPRRRLELGAVGPAPAKRVAEHVDRPRTASRSRRRSTRFVNRSRGPIAMSRLPVDPGRFVAHGQDPRAADGQPRRRRGALDRVRGDVELRDRDKPHRREVGAAIALRAGPRVLRATSTSWLCATVMQPRGAVVGELDAAAERIRDDVVLDQRGTDGRRTAIPPPAKSATRLPVTWHWSTAAGIEPAGEDDAVCEPPRTSLSSIRTAPDARDDPAPRDAHGVARDVERAGRRCPPWARMPASRQPQIVLPAIRVPARWTASAPRAMPRRRTRASSRRSAARR